MPPKHLDCHFNSTQNPGCWQARGEPQHPCSAALPYPDSAVHLMSSTQLFLTAQQLFGISCPCCGLLASPMLPASFSSRAHTLYWNAEQAAHESKDTGHTETLQDQHPTQLPSQLLCPGARGHVPGSPTPACFLSLIMWSLPRDSMLFQ